MARFVTPTPITPVAPSDCHRIRVNSYPKLDVLVTVGIVLRVLFSGLTVPIVLQDDPLFVDSEMVIVLAVTFEPFNVLAPISIVRFVKPTVEKAGEIITEVACVIVP